MENDKNTPTSQSMLTAPTAAATEQTRQDMLKNWKQNQCSFPARPVDANQPMGLTAPTPLSPTTHVSLEDMAIILDGLGLFPLVGWMVMAPHTDFMLHSHLRLVWPRSETGSSWDPYCWTIHYVACLYISLTSAHTAQHKLLISEHNL